MKKKVTIADIAKRLGVSITTVSLILNDKAKENRISDRLSKRVLDYVQKVGYKPNRLARGNRVGMSKTFGLVVDDIATPFYLSLTREIEEFAYNKGYHVLYCSMQHNDDRAAELLRLFHHKQIDGLIITPTDGMKETIQYLQKKLIPIVFVERNLDDVEANFVFSDNKLGAYQAVQSLFEDRKASKVGLVTTNSRQSHMKQRLEGYMKAVDEVNGDFSIKKINSSLPEDAVVEEINSFTVDNKLDGVFFACNSLALLGLKVIKERNLTIRNIASFDDHLVFSLVDPPVTAVVQNVQEIAHQVVTTLINEINRGSNAAFKQIVVPCQLIER